MSTRLKNLIPYWPPIFVGLLLAANLLYIRLNQLPVDQTKIEYGLILLVRELTFPIVLIAVVGFVLVLRSLLRVKWRVSRLRDIIYALSILVLALIVIPSSAFAVLSHVVDDGASLTHLDRLSFNGELYQLAYISQPPYYSKSSYNLYHCDSLGVMCERVYQIDTSTGTPHSDVDDLQIARTSHIVSDSTHNRLSIVVGTTSIGDYSPQQNPPS